MKVLRSLTFAIALLASASVSAQDMLDLRAVAMPSSPPVAGWAQTVRITRVDMDPRGGVALSFDHQLPDAWKFRPNALAPDENFLFTAWVCVQRTYCAGFVQMWEGRSMTDGSLPPILSGYENWWGDARHLWAEMSDYRPQPGDEIGFLVTAGNARLTFGISSVPERSNVVTLKLPAGDSGHFDFTGAPATPTPAPQPPVVIVTPGPAPTPAIEWSGVSEQLTAIASEVHGLAVASAAEHKAIDQDINDGRAENRSFFSFVTDHWKAVVTAVTSAYTSWQVCHSSGKC